MKTFLIITFLLVTTKIFANELAWVDQQIKAIKPSRTGISTVNVKKLKNPFIFLNAKKTPTKNNKVTTYKKTLTGYRSYKKLTKQKYFSLSAIMNGNALINSKWYKLNEKIKGYTISNIGLTTVFLTKNNKKIVLSTKSKNLPLKFKNK